MTIPGFGDSVEISNAEYAQFQQLIHKIAGISMSDSKRTLLVGRLGRRLRHHKMSSYSDYYKLVTSPAGKQELQQMVDLLTTNETYFFREPRHFEFLTNTILAQHPAGQPFNVWSGASSTGEEIYTLCMVLADKLGPRGNWSVLGSDLSTQVLAVAEKGEYMLERTRGLPQNYLNKYCQLGSGDKQGTFAINADLRSHTKFRQINLNQPIPDIGKFHVIFLRNVMIYFDNPTKRQVVSKLVSKLHPDGYLIIGHSESLNGLTEQLTVVQPTIYRLS
ncbi:MAG: protein-glutamate O-methyltransferase CheR [Rhodocyclaceae bacterium]|nr:protein-glutamate O-methyltransferase CheR [Rhodocyclaceae bacterium]